MKDDERQFLLAEFDQAWRMVLAIDERRFKFLEYYSAVFAGVVGVASVLVSWRGRIDVAVAIPLTVLLAGGVLIGGTFVGILLSERAANRRYREKINLIRGLFLENSTVPAIREYLSRKDIGVKVGSDEQPSGIGSTLRRVLFFLAIEMALMVLLLASLWIGVLVTP